LAQAALVELAQVVPLQAETQHLTVCLAAVATGMAAMDLLQPLAVAAVPLVMLAHQAAQTPKLVVMVEIFLAAAAQDMRQTALLAIP
jgi:hypothetical protein